MKNTILFIGMIAIKVGLLIMELHPFYCSAALMEVVNTHHKIESKSVTD